MISQQVPGWAQNCTAETDQINDESVNIVE